MPVCLALRLVKTTLLAVSFVFVSGNMREPIFETGIGGTDVKVQHSAGFPG